MFKKVIKRSSSVSVNGNVVHSRNNVNINGVNIEIPNGSDISIINGKLYVDGMPYTGEELKGKEIVQLNIYGNVEYVSSHGDVTVKGDVNGDVDASGSVSITGNVEGDIDASGSVNIKGSHIGDIDAGGSVNISK